MIIDLNFQPYAGTRIIRRNNNMSINYLKEATNPQAREKAFKSSVLTLSLSGEDHTLGNLLRARLSQNPDVEFTSYSMPHPSLPELNFRLQVNDNMIALDVFRQGLDDLIKLTKAISTCFNQAVGSGIIEDSQHGDGHHDL